MRFSSYVEKMGGGDTAAVHDAWSVHGKARQRQRAGEDIILLSIGDHDFATDPRIVAAAKTALDGGRHHYTPNLGEPATRQAAVDFHQRAIGEAITPDHVAIVPGAQAGAFTAAMAVLDAGDEVICFDPMYVTYAGVIMAPGAVMRFVPLRPENGFQPDPAEVRRAVGPRTRAIMLNSPHNPTGAVIPRAVLAALGDIAVAHDLWLISDEVYCTMTFERPHVSPRLVDGLRERTLSIYSLSKAF
ncbi:MAG: pyridoxal phosphate-dependent aminotransferase, partial [Pseudomonadota bacterium]|nr:pyridoxal phosphate-dependent aminotransferase [Pseudomonadota bacterium]